MMIMAEMGSLDSTSKTIELGNFVQSPSFGRSGGRESKDKGLPPPFRGKCDTNKNLRY